MAGKIKWPKIFIFGDSLTQFGFSNDGQWVSIIANEFVRKADVIARGFSGYNTRQCKELLPYLVDDLKDVCVAAVFLGANDANHPDTNPQQSVPLPEYKENLKSIVKYIQDSSDIKNIFLITPPPVDVGKWNIFCDSMDKPLSKDASLVTKYAEACKETAQEIGVECVDLHTTMLQQADWSDFLVDGLHFTKKGSEFVAAQMIPRLKTFLAKVPLGAVEDGIMPLWSDVSNTNPDASFKKWLKEHA